MELRLYSFVNFYFSSIQQGIQTGHAAVDLVRKYEVNYAHRSDAHIDLCEMVAEWADNHKTFIILNGGDKDGISAATATISASEFPFAVFQEPGINNAESVAVVLPESIFNARLRIPNIALGLSDTRPVYEYVDTITQTVMPYYPTHPHYELIKLLRTSKLAS
jgi:hypothetical protein